MNKNNYTINFIYQMELKKLFIDRRVQQFIAIYEAKNIHYAAENLGITQPALTVSLRHLEEELGAILFERSVKGMEPTKAGEVFYRFAINLKLGSKYALQEISQIYNKKNNTIRIGAGVGWTTTILPVILKKLRKKYPSLVVDLYAGVGDQLSDLFLSGELDVYLAAGSSKLPQSFYYSSQLLANLPMIAVADPQSTLAKKAMVTAFDLTTVNWAGFIEDESLNILAEHYFATRGVTPMEFSIHTNSPTTLISYLKESDLISVLIKPLAQSACDLGLQELKLQEPLWEMPVYLYSWAIADELSPMNTFKKLIQRHINLIV